MTTPKERPIFVLAEQLVQTWLRNEAVLAELERLRRRRERARAYMHELRSNATCLGLSRASRGGATGSPYPVALGRREALDLMARAGEELDTENASSAGISRRSATSSPLVLTHLPGARKYA